MSRQLFIIFGCIAAAFAWLVTHGTGRFLAGDWLSAAYDSLGESLLRGEASVSPEAIQFERFDRNGKSFMYFGPFPALMRAACNAVRGDLHGKWARISCLIAALLAVLPFMLAAARALHFNQSLTRKQRNIALCLVSIGWAFGTPLCYLVVSSRIYNEAILWGLCGSMCGLLGLWLLSAESKRDILGLWLLSIGCFVALLSRVTFAVPLLVALPVALFSAPKVAPADWRKTVVARAIAVIPALAGLGFQLWYNQARFGSPLVFFDTASYVSQLDHQGGFFSLARIPSTAWAYFGFTSAIFIDRPPFLRLAPVHYLQPELFVASFREQILSVTVGSSWLLLLAVPGLMRPSVGLLRAYKIGLASQAVLLLSFHFVTERYAADILPLLAFGLLVSLKSMHFSKKRISVLSISVIASSVIMLCCTLRWNLIHNLKAEPAYRLQLSTILMPASSERRALRKSLPLSRLAVMHEQLSPLPRIENQLYADLIRQESVGRSANHHEILMRPGGSLTYAIPDGLDSFSSFINASLGTAHCPDASIRFSVVSDQGDLLFRSDIKRTRDDAEIFVAPLGSAKTITLAVEDAGDGAACDQGVWTNPIFGKSPKNLSEPEKH